MYQSYAGQLSARLVLGVCMLNLPFIFEIETVISDTERMEESFKESNEL